MHNLLPVRLFEAVDHLPDNRESLFQRYSADQRAQILSLDMPHRNL